MHKRSRRGRRGRPETSEQSQETPATAYGEAERDWLGAVGAWRTRFDATLREFSLASIDDRLVSLTEDGDEETLSYFRALLDGLGECTETFRAEVGGSPTPRLEAGAEAILTACEYLERGVEEDLIDLANGNEDPFRDGVFWIGGGRDRLWTSNRQILLRADGRRLIPRGEPGESHVDVPLSDAANEVADLLTVQLHVRCWSEEDWPGVVEELSAFTSGAVSPETMAWASQSIGIHVSPAACAELTELGNAADTVDEVSARPLVAFAHELAYLVGISDDAIAECWGVQTADGLALALGATRADARALGRLYWARVFPQLPAELRSPECRSGGRFDLDPARPAWP